MRVSSLLAICCTILLSGCWGHSLPTATTFIRSVENPASTAETVQVFVDANGTFYPSGWKEPAMGGGRLRGHSLLNASVRNPLLRTRIESEERRQLADLALFGADKKRIF